MMKEQRKSLVTTKNGEIEAVIQGGVSYEMLETLALLKVLALGDKQVAEGRMKPVVEVVKRLRS